MTTRTDVPLVPVPFAERTTSSLWDSLTPKVRCQWCGERKPYGSFPVPPSWHSHNQWHTCTACLDWKAIVEGQPA